MENNEYKKIRYYLYNYNKLPQKIAEREEDIIDLYNNLKIGLEDVEKGNIRPFSEFLSEIKNRRQEES